MKQIIAHIDMDCFFAAVEEKFNPSLKGKPLIIGAKPGNRGVVCTANYEARKFGVKSAMPIWKAYTLCPLANFIEPKKELYSKESKYVMNVLKSFSDKMVQASIDEAYLDITNLVKQNSNLVEIARLIKKEVYKKTKLTCSIGIAESKYVAKIASAFNKPVGTTIVENPKEFLSSLPINKIPGIGKVANKKMLDLNIKTIGDFAKIDPFILMDFFGKSIIQIHNVALGIDKTGIYENIYSDTKSISREKTFNQDILLKDCETILPTLAKEVYDDLGDFGYKTISIKIRYSNFETITRNFSLKFSSKNYNNLANQCKILLQKLDENKKVRLFGIKISNLSENYVEQSNLLAYI